MTMPGTPSHRGGSRLGEGDAGERGPRSGQQVAEVLADGDAEVAVEGLEDDVDGFAAGRRWPRGRRPCGPGRGPGTANGPGRGTGRARRARRPSWRPRAGGVCVVDRAREQHDERDHEHGGQREGPPRQHQRRAAGAELRENVPCGPPQDVGVVEPRREHRERRVERDRHPDQQQSGDGECAHGFRRSWRGRAGQRWGRPARGARVAALGRSGPSRRIELSGTPGSCSRTEDTRP